ITAKLRSIYETKGEGCVKGNREYTRYLKGIREAITWSSSRLADKIRVHDEFIAYNKERLSLEQQIKARIDKIVNTLLPKLGKLSRCKFFYQKQKRVLKRAINSSNAQKRKILKKNSVNCEA
ncbi:CG17472, partial [Drosophila busckii]